MLIKPEQSYWDIWGVAVSESALLGFTRRDV